jgi:hypothetical protein
MRNNKVENILAVSIVGAVLGSWYLLHSPILALALVGAYFAPTMIANHRKLPNQGSLFVINLFLGWTFIGWVVALAMAVRSRPEPQASVAGGKP